MSRASTSTTGSAASPAAAPAGYPKDAATTGIILGAAGMAWFGWGQDGAPPAWLIPLRAGSVACLILLIAAIVTRRRLRGGGSAMADPATRRRYLIIVATEVAAILAGVIALNVTGHGRYTGAWVLLVVGVHFLPLARVFAGTGLISAGVVLIAVAAAAAIAGGQTTIAPAAIAGAGGGLVCGGRGLICLIRARSQAAAPAGHQLA